MGNSHLWQYVANNKERKQTDTFKVAQSDPL